jgi:hypothetical protein
MIATSLATTPDQLDELVRVVEGWADDHGDAISGAVDARRRQDQEAMIR